MRLGRRGGLWGAAGLAFEHLAAEAGWRATLTGGGEPMLIAGARVSPAYFEIFGVTPALGRVFLPGEDQPGRDRVVLLSHRLFERRFAAEFFRSLLGSGRTH